MAKIYMRVTDDKYELPVAIADTETELARMLGVRRNAVASALSNHKAGRHKKTVYRCVEIDDECSGDD